jgi:hypothetical protein
MQAEEMVKQKEIDLLDVYEVTINQKSDILPLASAYN